MAHDHSHEDQNNYYIEQLCSIGIVGAIGGIAVMLYRQEGGLFFLSQGKIKPWVLAGGIALLVMVAIRAVAVWVQAGRKTEPDHAHDHHHDHEHCEGHSHGGDCGHHHDHDHAVSTSSSSLLAGHTHDHDHDHDSAHGHGHSHSHGGDGHEHGWAPWRYVILLLPVVLYFLGLPSANGIGANPDDAEQFSGGTFKARLEITDRTMKKLQSASLSSTVLTKLEGLKNQVFESPPEALADEVKKVLSTEGSEDSDAVRKAVLDNASWVRPTGKSAPLVDFAELQRAPLTPESRKVYEGNTYRFKGEYMRGGNDYFTLVRYQMNCCARDAVPLRAVIWLQSKSGEILPHDKLSGQWLEVTGEVQFQPMPNMPDVWRTIIVLRPDEDYPLFDPNNEKSLIKIVEKDKNYYLNR